MFGLSKAEIGFWLGWSWGRVWVELGLGGGWLSSVFLLGWFESVRNFVEVSFGFRSGLVRGGCAKVE